MNVSEPFIRRPAGTSLLAMGLLLLGVVSYHFLPVAPVPRVDFPMVTVAATYPGADPATMASTVAAPLERRFGQIAGITEMTSSSALGLSGITLQFDLDRKVDGAVRDIQAGISAAIGELPPDLPNLPTYRKVNPADTPIMILTMNSDLVPATSLFDLADSIIGQRLSQIQGVSQVLITGAEKSAVRIQLHPGALALTGLGLEDVRNMLANSNSDQPKGSFEGASTAMSISTNDQLLKASDYEPLIVAQKGTTPIKLSALGNVVEGVENVFMAGWADTKPAVVMIIFKQSDANVIEVVDQIKKIMPQLKTWIPPSVDFKVASDRTITIRASVDDVQFSLALSVALVVLVMFLFLRRIWPTLIASVTVPLALAGTFGGMYLCNYTLDNLSLMALTISVGFVVDDAIVVIENIFRYVEEGYSPFEASLKGARQIGFTVISISISLIAVFIPLLFMGGIIGRLLHEFAVTLSMAIIVSAIISLTLTPSLCAKFLHPEKTEEKQGWFYRSTEWVFDTILFGYEKSLRWVLRHQVFMLGVAVATMAATFYLYSGVSKGFIPQQDTGMLMGNTEAAQDISFKAMLELQKKVTQIVVDDDAVASVVTALGSTNNATTINAGRMFIALKPLEKRKIHVDYVIARIREKMAKVGSIKLTLQAMQDIRVGGRMSKAQYIYSLQDPDLNELNEWAPKVLARLQKIKLLQDTTSDQLTGGFQTNVDVDRDAASRLGLTLSAIDNTLYDAFGQRQVSVLYQDYNQHHLVMELMPDDQMDPGSLNKIYVKSTLPSHAMVPLSAVAKFSYTNTFLSVNHQGQFPVVNISFNLPPGGSLGDATELINKAVTEMGLPSAVRASFQGTAMVFQSSLSSLPLLIVAALIAVYIVLGMLYESLIHPITILSTLPSAGVGALLALQVCHSDLSIVSFIGIILLMGIVKKNAIMMIDFALEAERHEGMSPEEAIFKACTVRFRPITMTTMAALFGAFPLAFGTGVGAELRQPLGIAVVGGLLVSQVLTLYTTPVIYLFFEHMRQRFIKHHPAKAAPTTPTVPGGVHA